MMCPDCGCDISSRTSECPNCHHIFYVKVKREKPKMTDYDIRKKQIELQEKEIALKERELQMLDSIKKIEAINATENAFSYLLNVLDNKRR